MIITVKSSTIKGINMLMSIAENKREYERIDMAFVGPHFFPKRIEYSPIQIHRNNFAYNGWDNLINELKNGNWEFEFSNGTKKILVNVISYNSIKEFIEIVPVYDYNTIINETW